MLLEHELEIALDLVVRCGAIALEIQRGGATSLQTSDKPDDQGPVTRADIAVETAIVATLRECFPNDAILAEELARDPSWQQAQRVWMIDPVDGTSDFAEGDSSWAVHVALTIDGQPALGIVHEPGRDRTSWAIDWQGERHAWCREGDAAMALPARGHTTPWKMVTSKSHRSGRSDEISARLGIRPDEQLRTGSTGVKIALIARGEAQMYAHPTVGTKLWDSCAPQVVLHASGGRLTDMRGQPLRYRGPVLGNDHGLLATGPGVDHQALVEQLRPLTDKWFPVS
ncbi:MAG TPA: 3'(2'),5'-bisphosphate nucleotidase CysQ [Enhygromyxa sp.]|nr:3'(2'),5'-bisphosphate nucleotidase CysQ [Enhygromyxa sp.]